MMMTPDKVRESAKAHPTMVGAADGASRAVDDGEASAVDVGVGCGATYWELTWGREGETAWGRRCSAWTSRPRKRPTVSRLTRGAAFGTRDTGQGADDVNKRTLSQVVTPIAAASQATRRASRSSRSASVIPRPPGAANVTRPRMIVRL